VGVQGLFDDPANPDRAVGRQITASHPRQAGSSGLLDDDIVGDCVLTGETNSLHLVVSGQFQSRCLLVGTNRSLCESDGAGPARAMTVAVEQICYTCVRAQIVFEEHVAEFATCLALDLFTVVLYYRHSLSYVVDRYILLHTPPHSPGVSVDRFERDSRGSTTVDAVDDSSRGGERDARPTAGDCVCNLLDRPTGPRHDTTATLNPAATPFSSDETPGRCGYQ
jgi:hypothetical protein